MKPSRARYGVVAMAIALAVLSYVQRVAISQAAGPISHDLHLNKAQMGLIFGAFGLSYALFELPMGLLGDKAWRAQGATANRSGMVGLHGADRRSLERRLPVDHSLSLWRWRSGVLPEPDAHAEPLASEERTDYCSVNDVGVYAMGRSGNSTVGSRWHFAVRMAMGFRCFRESWSGVVRGIYGVVSRRSGPA